MALNNTDTSWGAVAKWLHWIIAVLIIGTSIFILHVNDSTYWFKSGPEIFIKYIHWHKTFGLLALVFILIRLWWRRRQVTPVTAELTEAEQRWSHRVHLGLYGLMIVVPVTGWLSSSFFGSPTRVFDWFVIPPITPKVEGLVGVFYWLHFGLAWALLCLTVFHGAAALYHHFGRKDRTLKAMLPGG